MLTLAIPLAPVRTVGIVRKRTVERSLHLCAHPAASKALSFAFEVTFLADGIAAGHIACRAAVNRPYCSDTGVALGAQRVRRSRGRFQTYPYLLSLGSRCLLGDRKGTRGTLDAISNR